MKQNDFEKLIAILFGDNNFSTLEGLPTCKKQQFTKKQLDTLTRNVLAHLAKYDLRAIRVSGDIRLIEAKPILEKMAKSIKCKINKYLLIEVFLALWHIAKDKRSFEIVAKILENDMFFLFRNYAAFSLKYFPFEKTTATALLKGLKDSNDLVKITCFKTLITQLEKNNIYLPKSFNQNVFLTDQNNALYNDYYKILQDVVFNHVN